MRNLAFTLLAILFISCSKEEPTEPITDGFNPEVTSRALAHSQPIIQCLINSITNKALRNI